MWLPSQGIVGTFIEGDNNYYWHNLLGHISLSNITISDFLGESRSLDS